MYLAPINAVMALFGTDKATYGYVKNAQKSASQLRWLSLVMLFITKSCISFKINAMLWQSTLLSLFVWSSTRPQKSMLLAPQLQIVVVKHKGGSPKDKCERTMVDIVKICVDPMVKLPMFYSINMARVPPVGVEHSDVSALVQEIAALRDEVRSFAAVRAEIADIRTTLGAIGGAKQDVVDSSSAIGVIKSDISLPISVLTGTNPATAAQSSNMLMAGASSFATMAKSLHASGINEHKN